jgi:hypothetical protein
VTDLYTAINLSNSSFAAAEAVKTDAVANLQAYSQAMFCTMPKSPQVMEVLGPLLAKMPSSADVARMSLEAKSSAATLAAPFMPGTPESAVPPINPESVLKLPTPVSLPPVDTPVAVTCGIGFNEFTTNYSNHSGEVRDKLHAQWDIINSLTPKVVAWRDARWSNPTFDEVKKAKTEHPADTTAQATYAAYSAELQSQCPDYPALMAAIKASGELRTEYARLRDQYATWLSAPGGFDKHVQCDKTKW